jgi:hypothetical protein
VPSTVAEARARIGSDPLERIFEMSAQKWGHESARKHAWRGLALYGVDGSTLRVADSTENRAHFGGTKGERGDSGYPLVRIAALMALRSHILVAAEFGPYEDSEITLSAFLWRAVPDDALVMVDRGFLAAGILVPLVRDGKNRHWLTRAKSTTKWRVVKHLGKDDDLVELTVSREARIQDPSLPATYMARAIRYQVKGFRPATVLTSMLDHEEFPAAEVASVDQELWGILLAYNLIRLEMERTADDFGVEPTRISFVTSLRIICDTWSWCALASPGALPVRLKTMRELFTSLVLPERRRSRRYPRAVKIKMSNFPRKRPSNA